MELAQEEVDDNWELFLKGLAAELCHGCGAYGPSREPEGEKAEVPQQPLHMLLRGAQGRRTRLRRQKYEEEEEEELPLQTEGRRRRQRGRKTWEEPEHLAPEWEEPERPAPEWEEPERPAPEWEEPERPAPEWEEPERPAPEWEEPERPAPEWEEPERPAPEWEEPERPAPEWEEPERPAPEWEEPERPAPEWEEPERPAPEWEEPERPAPEWEEPERPAPEWEEPERPAPEWEEPERPAPEWEEPERPAPEWEEPERPAPEWEEPERPAPEWEEPERPAPEWEENCHCQSGHLPLVSLESRALHLATLVREAEQRVIDITAQVVNEAPGERDGSEREKQLKGWEWRHRLFKRMKAGFEHARPPEAPSNVRLSVCSSSSLRVTFHEPLSVNSAVVTKYRVEWSCSPSFSPLLGEAAVEDLKALHYTITALCPGTQYYVQVSAYNMKGWGPAQSSVPVHAAPSSWREFDGRAPRQRGQKEALDQLLGQIKDAHRHCTCHESCKVQPQIRKHSVSKSLRYLFQPTSKFVKTLKRGLYLTSIFYRDDNILVTQEDQIPIMEIDDSYSSSLVQDFLWFSKGMLGTQDLGRVYFEPIKDKHGNALLVTMRDLGSSQSLENVRWTQLSKLQMQRKSISSPEEPTALDMLLITLHEKLAYHRRSKQALSPGLYLGYLKLCSSVDQIRVLVPQKLPNMLCHVKVRHNHNISREEWEWLQNLSSLDDTVLAEQNAESPQNLILQDLRAAARELMGQINIPVNQAQHFRIYSQEVLEFGEKVSFLLLLPPSDDVCTVPGQNNPYSPRSGFLTLPLQIFELVHFYTYSQAFIGQYCRVSALLELESLMSQQTLREAFSESELLAAKQKHQQVQEHVQQMEEVWREMRWIMDALQYARYKQPSGGISLAWIIDFSQEAVSEKSRSTTSSQLDYLPSPTPSPETGRKHNSDLHGISDEEGSSEVFLATDSDYDSSRAQSPRDLDLISSSPSSSSMEPGCPRIGSRGLRDSAPDVLLAHELQPAVPGEHRCPPELFDSDFILPSRQIELLRITEKRQAFCVRTSSMEFPAPDPGPSPRRRCPRPSSVDRCPPSKDAQPTLPPLHARARSEEGTNGFPETANEVLPASEGRRPRHVNLRVYPQYRTGLSKETSVKLCVTQKTTAREIVRLVVMEMNSVSRRLLGSLEEVVYREEQLEHFGLVLVVEETERWLQDDFQPLALQNPWTRGRLCVRMKEYSPLSLQLSQATTV
ncbi:UNVERIFIED_CONTAM: hypothetical protein FKN15_030962 [Acipenser sinensis]